MKPLNDYVVIERIEDTTDNSLIVISDDGKEKQPIGKVIEVGPGVLLDNGQRKNDS